MSSSSSSGFEKRTSMRPHSSYDAGFGDGSPSGSHPGSGVAIQCQYCPAQAFRRSRLRIPDLKHLFFMRYPVRCLRCGQRQTVSFTVAGISVPSHVKQRKARNDMQRQKHWTGPVKDGALHTSGRPEVTSAEAPQTVVTGTQDADSLRE